MEHLAVPDRPDRPEQPDVVKEKSLQNNVFKNTIHVFCFRYLFFLYDNQEKTFENINQLIHRNTNLF